MESADRIRTPFGAFLRDVGDEAARSTTCRRGAPGHDERATWRRLLEPVRPVSGESLRGLVARSCCVNGLPNSFGLLQHLGLVHRNRVIVAEDPGIDPAELAYAIRVPKAEVMVRRYEALGPGRVSFHGLDVNARQVEIGVRRFSPTAFRADGSDRPLHHRATWELRDIPFCLEGWDMLQERCHCDAGGVRQGWSRTATNVDECDRCGDPLAWQEPFPVPARMRPALGVLKAIVFPIAKDREAALDGLPAALRDADRSALFDLVVRLGKAIDPHASQATFEQPETRLRPLHAACAALRRWPGGLSGVTLAPGTSDNTKNVLVAAWNRLARHVAPVARRQEACRSGTVRSAQIRVPARTVGVRLATETARLSPKVLLAAWQHGLVARLERRHGDRVVPAFDQAELVDFGERWRGRREPDSVAFELGLPRYGLEQLCAMGCIIADAPAMPGSGPHFTEAAVTAFLDALGHAPPIIDARPIRHVMRMVGGRPKPWGPAFRLMLDGDLPFGVARGSRLTDRIVVPSEVVAQVVALEAPSETSAFVAADTMVQNDALEVLNAAHNHSHLLVGLRSQGRNPRRYRVEDVLALAREIVTVPEIAARLSIDPATAWQMLRRQGLLEMAIARGAWPRRVLQHLS